MYDSTYGIINSLLMDMGIIDLPIAWLSNPKIVLFSAIIVNIWRGVPFFMFSILGELQTLDRQVYEAATVDGAGIFKQFWYITLPSIAPVIKVTTLLSTIWKHLMISKCMACNGRRTAVCIQCDFYLHI